MDKFKGLFIPKVILQDKRLGMSEKLILSEIHYLDGENGCYATNAHLGDVVGLSKRQVSEIISRLKEKSYLVWEPEEKNRSGRTLRSNVEITDEVERYTIDTLRQNMRNAEARAIGARGDAVVARGREVNGAEHDFF